MKICTRLLLTTLIAVTSLSAQPQSTGLSQNSRLTHLEEELRTLQTALEKTPEGRERRKLDQRRSSLERERESVLRIQKLEIAERRLAETQKRSPAARLQDQLQAIDANIQGFENRIQEYNAALRGLMSRRTTLVDDQRRAQNTNEETPPAEKNPKSRPVTTRASEIENDLVILDRQIAALHAQRDAQATSLDLAREAQRISDQIKTASQGPRTSIRTLLSDYLVLDDTEQRRDDFTARREALQESIDSRTEAVDLARQKLDQIDEQITILGSQTSFWKSIPEIDRLLDSARSEKARLTATLPHLVAHRDAITESNRLLTAANLLLATEREWRRDLLQQRWDRFREWVTWPASALLTAFLIFFLVSRLALPRFYSSEMLLIARRLNRYLGLLACTVIVAAFFLEDLQVLATTLGIVSAAIVIALQDPICSLAGWFAIIMGGKFRVGDRIEVDGSKGDVIDIQLLRTTVLEVNNWLGMDQPTGRVMFMPNNFIFKSRVFNSTHGHPYIWARMDVGVTNESPREKCEEILRRVLEEETAEVFALARKAAEKFKNRYGTLDANYQPKFFVAMGTDGVIFTLVYVADCRAQSAMRDRLNRRILEEFDKEPRIQTSFPTTRTYVEFHQKHGPDDVQPGIRHLTAFPENTTPQSLQPVSRKQT